MYGVGVEVAAELAYDDFATKVAEMLKTDPELSSKLDVTRTKTFRFEDGKVRAADGTPIVDIVMKGFDTSRNSEDYRLRTTQAIRDEGDVMVAEAVDGLAVGEAMIVVSMDPKEELAGKDAQFWHDRGYRPGIAYIQWYARVGEDEVSAAAFSADHSDIGVWRDLMLSRGVIIPEDINPNTFIRHAWTFKAEAEEAKSHALLLRKESYERAGAAVDRLSIDEYLEAHGALMQSMFHAYYPAVGKALVTGQNQPEIQEFAEHALRQLPVGKLAPDVLKQIMRIAHKQTFDAAMGRAMDELIPYATVEQLRKPLTDKRSFSAESFVMQDSGGIPFAEIQLFQQQTMHRIALAGLRNGLTAGRSYGGCSGVNVAAQSGDLETLTENPQDVFGGRKDAKELLAGEDQYGPLTFKCTEGHTNTRKRGQLLTECQHTPCKKGSVGCG
jgi:hypothetical protein